MQRYAMVIQLKPDKIDEYKALHQHVWPEVLSILSQHHIKNYSIFIKDHWLFGYLEYHGNDYANDMKEVADKEVTQHWWRLTAPCQEPLPTRAKGEWWSLMQEVFHLE
jgi:L-rhamnose mutarotase